MYDNSLFNLVNRDVFTTNRKACYLKQMIPEYIKHIKVTGKSASATYYYDLGAFYDANNTLIERFGNENNKVYTDLLLTVPKGTHYIIVNQNEVSSDSYTKVKFLEVSNLVVDISENTKNISEIQQDISIPIEVEATEVFENYLINTKNLEPYSRANSCYIKQEIPEDCKKILISGKCASSKYDYCIGAFYDKDNKLLSQIDKGDFSDKVYVDYETEVPSGAKYLLVNQNGIPSSRYKKVKMFLPLNIYEYFHPIILDNTKRISEVEESMNGSLQSLFDNMGFEVFNKFGVIGDSLTVGHTTNSEGTAFGRNIYYSWGQFLARRLGNVCLNFGRSGVSSKLWLSNNEPYCYPMFSKEENKCQCYIIALGANDTPFELGSISDIDFDNMDNNAETEYGYYSKVIKAVNDFAPDSIVFLATIPYPRNTDVKIQAINNMIRELAGDTHFRNVHLLDLDANYNEYFKTGILEKCIGNTGWHLTSLGYLLESKVIQKALSEVILANYEDFHNVAFIPMGSNNVVN